MNEMKKLFNPVCVACLLCLFSNFNNFCSGKTDYSKIINRKIFADTPPPQQKPVKSILKPAPEPALDSIIALKGIIYNPDGDSLAIVEITERKTETVLSEGDIIENAYVKKINEFDVEFSYNGRDIKLTLPKPQIDKTAIAIKDSSVKVFPGRPGQTSTTSQTQPITSTNIETNIPVPQQPKSINLNEISEKMRSDPSLLASVSVTPFVQDGRVEGFVVNRVPEGGISAQIGIQPGDVIKRINGTLIDSLARAYAVYNTIISSQTKLVTVEIIRSGQPLILTYRLE
ncbi:MAG: PDZ domain-containing protein [bacterium]|nr:PDZ domain-containing protein [bacterium]